MGKNRIFRKNSMLHKIQVFFLIVSFLSTGCAYAQTPNVISDKLAPECVSQTGGSVIADAEFISVACSIAKHFYEDNGRVENLPAAMIGQFTDAEQYLADQLIDLDSITGPDDSGILTFTFTGQNGQKGIAKISLAARLAPQDISAGGWQVIGKYAILVEPYVPPEPDNERDLKEAGAPESNLVIQELIKSGQIAEFYIDPETDSLKGNRVKWVKNYIPLRIPPELYRGPEINVNQLFTPTAKNNMERWMREHSVRGSPVKFRVVLGAAALGWESKVKHSNFVHAAVRDKCIYIGAFLLEHVFRDGNERLREEILDKDDLRHLYGLGHGSEEEHSGRLKMVRQLILSERLEEIHTAMTKKDVYYLKAELSRRIAEGPSEVLEMLSAVNNVALSQPLYPVERTYPIKHAVALLEKEEQEKLVDILTNSQEAGQYREQNVIYEILLMLGETTTLKDWVDVHAPKLRGRALWQVSPEIWHEAGGLARVMQYHGAGIKELTHVADVRFRQIEPHYQNRIDAQGRPHPLDYTNTQQLTHPIKGQLEEVAQYYVTVGKRKVKVVASRGVNDLGIEIFLIRDVQENGKSYYTHSLYNYRNPWENNPELPTWEEFSVFYSKASLELIRIVEEGEKEELGNKWKAPVIHLNDSQVALVSVYRKIFFDNDPVLGPATVAFTTHTYGNRKHYPRENGYGDGVMEFMEIPVHYREFFEREFGRVYDMASAGLRTADWQGAVARAHRDDIVIYDDWVNYPQDPVLVEYYKKMGVSLSLVAVANGDHRSNTAVYFDQELRKLFGNEVDVEHPTPDQVYQAKREAKLDLALGQDKVYYSTHVQQDWERSILSPDQMVISYSGRLVPEKAGRKRAFCDENVKALLRNGIQVVIYGNVQVNNTSSSDLAAGIVRLINELRGKPEYTGRLIFVPRFSLNEQRALLAATDVQVQDSDPSTEAAGFTEADVSRTGGIEVGTKREDNEVGEGLFQAQGVPMDLEKPGKGNVLIPDKLTADAYLETLLKLYDKYQKGELKHYQATSVRLSRVLEARLTSAAYLKEFSKAVEEKEAGVKAAKLMEEIEREEKGKRSFLEQILHEGADKDPARYLTYRVCELVMSDKTDEALVAFFTNEAFQGQERRLSTLANVLNKLIEVYVEDKRQAPHIRSFIASVSSISLEMPGIESDTTKSVEMMCGQALTIMSWIKMGVDGAAGMRVTSEENKMVTSSKGLSYLAAGTLPKGLGMTEKEGNPGFYWRGSELTAKLGDNVLDGLKHDKKRFDEAAARTVMYIMDHGFTTVPEALRSTTEKGLISTLHETVFINDLLPGSLQTTSTGAGHFQGDKLDVKYVTAGRGMQLNVKYDKDGRIAEVIAYEIAEGDWCLALPGYVDYMINFGGLRFNDMSVSLTPDEARVFNKDYDATSLKELEAVVKTGGKKAPYIGMIAKRGPVVAKALENAPDITIARLSPPYERDGLFDVYDGISSLNDLKNMIEKLAAAHESSVNPFAPARLENALLMSVEEAGVETVEDGRIVDKAPTLDKAVSMHVYIDDNRMFLNKMLASDKNGPKLIRIPVELVEAVGVEEIRGLLDAVQATPNGYIEFYSQERPEGVDNLRGLRTKAVPDSLRGDNRNRTNTITIMPVEKGEELSENRNKRWEGVEPEASIVMPVGYGYDRTGLVRSVLFGLRLTEIAREEGYGPDSNFVAFTLAQYMDLCVAFGTSPRDFNLTGQDLVNIARGNMKTMVRSLNKLIKLLPIIPFNTEELRIIFERVRKSIDIRA